MEYLIQGVYIEGGINTQFVNDNCPTRCVCFGANSCVPNCGSNCSSNCGNLKYCGTGQVGHQPY
jgi:hypothetical protein